jgi:tRNA threonylcarbamoyladenosine biosynthesis protein TsaE
MVFPFKKEINTEEDTIAVAEEFSRHLQDGQVVCLNGNLGAGKTFFIKQIVKQYGITNASSPTFAIVNEYTADKRIYHFDFYRINKINELYDIGFNDYINDNDSIVFIEWAELFPEALPSNTINVHMILNDDSTRIIEINSNAGN